MDVKPGSVTVEWKVKRLSEFFGTKDVPQDKTIMSPRFRAGTWAIYIRTTKDNPDELSLWLKAFYQPHEKVTNSLWRREGETVMEAQILRPDGSTLEESGPSTNPHLWEGSATTSTFGWPVFASASQVYFKEPAIVEADCFIVRFTLHHPKYLEQPALIEQEARTTALDRITRALFDNFASADVCFLVHGYEPSVKRSLFAHKVVLTTCSDYFQTMFSPGFFESAVTSSSSARSSASNPTEAPQSHRLHENDDDALEWLPSNWDEQTANGEATRLVTEGQGSAEGKTVVQIEDFGHTTYRAMIYYLYTRTIDFTPPASNFVIELAKNKENPPTSRHDFLLSKTTRTNTAVEPASAHTIYQLADKIDLDDLKELAKTKIVAGFTVENILYELVSSFSYQHDEIQDAAIDFALKNWDAVKSNGAFDIVVEGASDIEGGLKILAKLMKRLAVVKTE